MEAQSCRKTVKSSSIPSTVLFGPTGGAVAQPQLPVYHLQSMLVIKCSTFNISDNPVIPSLTSTLSCFLDFPGFRSLWLFWPPALLVTSQSWQEILLFMSYILQRPLCNLLPTNKHRPSLFPQGAPDWRQEFSVLHPPAVWELHLLHLAMALCTVSMMPRTSIFFFTAQKSIWTMLCV